MNVIFFLIIICLHQMIADDCPYLILMDAGSTKTKAYLYNFGKGISQPIIQHTEEITPPLSYYANKPNKFTQLKHDLNKTLQTCSSKIPEHCKPKTKVILKSTAGIRMLKPEHIKEILMEQVEEVFGRSGFKFKKHYASILSEKDEALDAWVALNVLSDKLTKKFLNKDNFGMIELGGSSIQIAFVCHTFSCSSCQNYPIFHQSIMLHVHSSKSFFGLNIARMMYLEVPHECQNTDNCNGNIYRTVCMNKDYEGKFQHGLTEISVRGKPLAKGEQRYEQCFKIARQIVQIVESVPKSDNEFVTISGFYHVINNAFFLMRKLSEIDAAKYGSKSDYQPRENYELTVRDLDRMARHICENPSQLVSDSRVIFIEYTCMDLTYITALLQYGYQFPENTQFSSTLKMDDIKVGWPFGTAMKYYEEDAENDRVRMLSSMSIFHRAVKLLACIIIR